MGNIGARKIKAALTCTFVAFVALLASYAWNHGFGVLRKNSLAPPNDFTEAVAISADGTQVAILYRETADGAGGFFVQVRNVQTGRQVSKLTIPWPTSDRTTRSYYVSPKLSFCDGGKYLVAFVPPDGLYLADTRTFELRDLIRLSALRLTAEGAGPNPPNSPIPAESVGEFDCAASSGVAVLGFWADLGVAAIKLIDLDTGKEITDLGGIFKGLFFKGLSQRYDGDGLAISPDGSKVAMVIWQFGDIDGGPGVDVVDVRTRQIINRLHLDDDWRTEHRLAFAGNGALVIGEPECQPNGKCDIRSPPSNRKLRLWDFAGTGAVRMLGPSRNDTYRYFGASANGKVVFAYTGAESYCGGCNSKRGELKVHNARFIVWDRASGSALALSPSLRVENHSCPWFSFRIGAPCDSYQQVPQLTMSANGRSILAFWPHWGYPPLAADDLEVYTLRGL